MDTKKLRQKILDLAIRGKLVPQDPNDEPASVLLERIRAEKERLIKEGKIKRSKKSASDDEIEAPNGWVCCRFDEICSKFSTGPFGSMVHKSDYVSKDGTPIVNPMNIVEGKISTNNLMMVSNEKAQELDRYRLTKDDILIARRGDLRKCCIVTEDSVDWICGTGSFFLHVPFVEPRYIEFFYLSEYVQMILKRECVGATMDNLNQSVLGSIPFLLPPLSEQKRIVNAVERWFVVIDALESNEGDLLKAIDKVKSKILDLAIHGKLVPQDPNDEPASVLLDKIRKEKARLVKEGKLKKKDLEETPISEDEIPFKIPESWEWHRIGFLASLYTGNSISKDVKESKYINVKGRWYIGTKDVNFDNTINYDNGVYIPEKEEQQFKIAPSGSILMCIEGGSAGRKIGIIDRDVCFGNKLCCFLSYGIFNMFIYYYLQSSNFKEIFNDNKKGIIGGVSINMMSPLLIPVPPLAEQHRIVAKIEELFKEIDKFKV